MRRWSTRVWVGHVGPKADSPNTCKNQTHVKTTRLTDIIDSLLLKQSETNMFPDVPCNHPQQWGLNKQHGPLPGIPVVAFEPGGRSKEEEPLLEGWHMFMQNRFSWPSNVDM